MSVGGADAPAWKPRSLSGDELLEFVTTRVDHVVLLPAAGDPFPDRSRRSGSPPGNWPYSFSTRITSPSRKHGGR